MQQKWAEDPDKLTFIILDRQQMLESDGNEIFSMIGDTNLFLINGGEDSELESEVELEIMIADPAARRKGLASESLKLLMIFAIRERICPKRKFTVKIGVENFASCRMFEKFGFVKVGVNEIFNEVQYFFDLSDDKLLDQFINETKYELINK